MAINNKHTIAFVAGRSGGHLLPCLTKARQASEQEQASILFFATSTALDKNILQNFSTPCTVVNLPLDNVPYGKPQRFPLFLFGLLYACIKSFYHLIRTRPQKIVSMGGYISIPVCISAWMLRIPIDLYELNAIPGKAVTFLAPFAQNIFVCFEESKKYLPQKKCRFTQYPIRFSHTRAMTQQQAIANLNLNQHRKTIVVLGGSQGSLFLNDMIKKLIQTNIDFSRMQIIHQTGSLDTTNWVHMYAEKNIPAIVFDYTHSIEQIYQAADVIICRAGAGTLFEALFFGKQCITIPLETKTTDHQKINAYALSTQYPHLLKVLEQKNIEQNPNALFSTFM